MGSSSVRLWGGGGGEQINRTVPFLHQSDEVTVEPVRDIKQCDTRRKSETEVVMDEWAIEITHSFLRGVGAWQCCWRSGLEDGGLMRAKARQCLGSSLGAGSMGAVLGDAEGGCRGVKLLGAED